MFNVSLIFDYFEEYGLTIILLFLHIFVVEYKTKLDSEIYVIICTCTM